MANKTLTHREGNSILKASFNRRKITAVEDDIICTEKIIAERKTFFLDLKQNARGKVVRITEKVASMSCKAAVKGNNELDFRQAEELMRELMSLDNPYHCPHGRPTMIRMTKRELEKKFKRIV